MNLSVRLGIRNLARHRWRSILTLGGVAAAVALMVWTLAFVDGWLDLMVRGATAVETGQVQVHSRAYADQPRVYRSFHADDAFLDTLTALSEVDAAAPRVKLAGLVGNERTSQVARLLGVDPTRETETTAVAEGVVEGRWLSGSPADLTRPREVVLGRGLARQLRVAPGDELVVFLEAADGSLGNDLLQVVGVLETGNSMVDRGTAYMHIEDAQWVAALDGEIHEVALRTADPELAPLAAAAVAARLEALDGAGLPEEEGLVAQPWQELLPGLSQILSVSRESYLFMYLMVYLVAAVGILNTQRMSAQERRREFGVLVAVGLAPRRLLGILVVEALVLGMLGALAGGLVGGVISWWHATAGLDLSVFTDQGGFSYMGVVFEGRIFARMSAAAVAQPVLVMLVVAVLSGLWPAWVASRIEPAPTIAGRT
ncbi:MAG: ABC transporter permease [Gemmatimonadales bacterium]|jgi:ABC-type lipoprotein release transport system permease subunit|nr:MAG: ABC transporter permease [Gemmatimonadales bacterium]